MRWGRCAVELSPPSPLLLLNYYTILGALGITKLRKAWSFLSRSRGSMRGEKMYIQVSQRWARCDDCLDRGRRDYFHPGIQRLCTWGMDERSAGRHWREGQFLERKAWPRPQRRRTMLRECWMVVMLAHGDSSDRLVRGWLQPFCTGLTHQAMESRLCLV